MSTVEHKTEYGEGDLIRVHKGETHLVGRVVHIPSNHHQKLAIPVPPYDEDPEKALFIDYLEGHGYEVVVIEKARRLPAEPGWYLDARGRAFCVSTQSCAWWGDSQPIRDESVLAQPFRRMVHA